MSDNQNPASQAGAGARGSSSPTAPSGSDTSTTTQTAPDGSTSTVLTAGVDAQTPTGTQEQAKTETKAETSAFDVSKLVFPEELGKPDEARLNKFGEVAKSLNLTQEGAQQLADLYTENMKAASEANLQAWKSTIETWQGEIQKDPEIGGDKLRQHQVNFARVLADPRFHVDGVVDALMLTGAGSNPAINRFMAKLASALLEGGMVTGSPPSQQQQPRTMAQAMYPNNPSEAR